MSESQAMEPVLDFTFVLTKDADNASFLLNPDGCAQKVLNLQVQIIHISLNTSYFRTNFTTVQIFQIHWQSIRLRSCYRPCELHNRFSKFFWSSGSGTGYLSCCCCDKTSC
uniref:Alcohol dehydrogenase 1 n=1 Tax=Lygus hesperus TaxID=30085 RepID=A0A0A9Z6V9_LYGHE